MCFLWEKVTYNLSYGFYSQICKGGDDPKLKAFYTEKACHFTFLMQYFTVSAVWAYCVLKPTGWLPWQLGGSASLDEAFKAGVGLDVPMPLTKYPRSVLVYALATNGYHISAIINQLMKEKASDFYEMLLHHIATCALYFCMIFGNGLSIGCVIAFLHDIADIFVGGARICNSTSKDGISMIFFACLLVSWVWTRIILLPQIIYRIFMEDWDYRCRLFCQTNGFFLVVLQFMHIYWLILLVKMALNKVMHGKIDDIQNQPVSKKTN